MGPWQGQHGNKNMDAETLAQTLVTVAQNLLSTQSQSSNPGSNNRTRPSPWSTSGPQSSNYGLGRDQGQQNYSSQEREPDQRNYSGQVSDQGQHYSSQDREQGQQNYSREERDHSQQNYSHEERGHGQQNYVSYQRDLCHASSSNSRSNRNTPKPLMGLGLLGAPPDGDYRSVRESGASFVIGEQQDLDQSWGEEKVSSGGYQHSFGSGFGIGEDSFVEKVKSRGSNTGTEKSRKNYREKIKEEGCPPKYVMSDFEHLPRKLFRCTMCGKEMWNSISFVNHLKGNAHNKTVDEVAAKEASKVAAVREQITHLVNKDVGSSRPKPGDNRGGKCAMCGVKAVRDMLAHRRTDFHQKLKQFIHPHCTVCHADFEERSDWYYHKFSAEHLTNLEVVREGIEYDPMSAEELEKLLKVLEKRSGRKKDRLNNIEPTRNVDKNEMFKEMRAAAKLSENIYSKKDDEDIIIMEEEDTVPEKGSEPKLINPENLGSEFIKPVNGMFCKLCKKFFGAGNVAIAEHCRTQLHADKYRVTTQNLVKKRSSASEFFSSPKKKK